MSKLGIKVKPSYAGFWRRLTANLIDGWIVTFIGVGISFSLGTDPFKAEASTFLENLDQLLTFVMAVGFAVLFWVNYVGTTPGKRWMGIKIISTKRGSISYPQALVRYFGQLLSTVVFLLGYLWVIWDAKKQTWHDKMADTIVISTSTKNYFWRSFAVIAFTVMGFLIALAYFYQEVSK